MTKCPVCGKFFTTQSFMRGGVTNLVCDRYECEDGHTWEVDSPLTHEQYARCVQMLRDRPDLIKRIKANATIEERTRVISREFAPPRIGDIYERRVHVKVSGITEIETEVSLDDDEPAWRDKIVLAFLANDDYQQLTLTSTNLGVTRRMTKIRKE